MAKCDVCGNEYEKPMEISLRGKTYMFDSFECAITRLAPHCANCDCRIVGHGVERNGKTYRCDHCARQ